MATAPEFNNLVKQSVGRFFPNTPEYTTTPLITRATGSNTTAPSVNGKIVTAARWNKPLLNTSSGFAATSQIPQWINLDRQGIAPTQAPWSNTFRDYTPGNDRAVIGRFAFNVYDVGGLLDANVAGYPIFTTALTSAQLQQLKSSEAGAFLYDANGPLIPDFDQTRQATFVNTWRYGSTSTSSANFFLDFMSRNVPPSSAVSPTFADSGFMRPTVRNPASASSDTNTIAYSRQNLIRMVTPGYITAAALPYFTHFSRELNAPSWTPTKDASALGGNNGVGNVYAYAANKDQASATNRDILNVRVGATAFVRSDGTQANTGELLMKHRFPLRRLDGIGTGGVNTGGFPVMVAGTLIAPTSATVLRDTGLVWDATNTRWVYNSPTATRYSPATSTSVNGAGSGGGNYDPATGNGSPANAIKNLAQVAAENREPDFFEVLKAFILSGSVGVGTDNTGTGRTLVDAEPRYFQGGLGADAEIMQIGINIIDQRDADKNPTFVYFAGLDFAGIENLPFLNKIGFQSRWTSTTAFTAFLVPSFWNPAQNGAAVGTQSATIPSVRFVMTSGNAYGVVESAGTPVTSAAVAGSSTQPSVTLTSSFNFQSPDAASSSTTVKPGMITNGNSKLGIQLPFGAMGAVTKANSVRAYPKLDNVTFEMQAQIGGASGPWKTYQRWTGCTVNKTSVTAMFQPPTGFDWSVATILDPEFVLLDPRTMRFGVWETDGKTTADVSDFNRGWNESLDRGTTTGGLQKITGFGPQGTSFSGVGAEMASNTAASPGYVDLDGVRRTADALTPGATSVMLPTNTADRPPMLNAQTRTTPELGTVSRDQPWKTLDFTTAASGDAALLDAFCIFEPNSVLRSNITAGKVSLNTRQPAVLKAVLNGIAMNTNNSTPLITTTQRDDIVTALTAMTSTQPMLNKSELVTRLAAHSSVTGLGNKEAREAVIRALSDVGQTRTWNLMIDVIAQTGRYGSRANSLDEFNVEGEKRYWLHIAIDRFTGQVIDTQLEPVSE